MRHKWGLALAAVGATLALGAAEANAEVVLNTTFPTAGTVPGCVEPIAYSGEDHLLSRVTSDSAGGFYDAIHRNIHVIGTGVTSGTNYVLDAESNVNEHFVGASDFTAISEEVFVSKGGLPNLAVEIVEHMTVDANGNITSDKFSFSGNCRA